MKMKKQLIYAIVLILFACSSHAAIFLGTCDGYVKDMSNNPVENASVEVNVNGCSGGASNGCSVAESSQSNGYYVAANLNLETGETVSVSATATLSGNEGSGSETATANSFQAARANITLCFPPSSPSLILIDDSHNNSVEFYWNSGTDPFGYSTYDEFRIDSGSWQTKISGFSSDVSYSSHTWQVRTCNTNGVTGCCSDAASDSFEIYNTPPLPPTLDPQEDTHETSATLSWSGGSDPDGDSIYYQFQFDSGMIQNDSTSPVTVSGLDFGSHSWRVRTCDFLECGAWATDSFNVINDFPSAPGLKEQDDTISESITLEWISGTDPDGDTTHDEFEFSDRYDFSTILHSANPASSPIAITGLADFEKYYWRIRTCDDEGCSGWVSDSFIKYECDSTGSSGDDDDDDSSGGGGSGIAAPILLPSEPTYREPAEEEEVIIDEKESSGEEEIDETLPEEIEPEEKSPAKTPSGAAVNLGKIFYDNIWWLFAIIMWIILLIAFIISRIKRKPADAIKKEIIKEFEK